MPETACDLAGAAVHIFIARAHAKVIQQVISAALLGEGADGG